MARGRGRPAKTTGVPQPKQNKRSAPADSDGELSAPKKAKTTKDKAPIEPRAPSSRTALNDKPPAWAPLVPRTNRSHEEVQAEKDRIAAAAEDRERQRRELMAKIAAIDAATDQAAAEEEANAVLTLDDVQHGEDTFMTFTESDFERADDDESYHSGGESEPNKKVRLLVRVLKAFDVDFIEENCCRQKRQETEEGGDEKRDRGVGKDNGAERKGKGRRGRACRQEEGSTKQVSALLPH